MQAFACEIYIGLENKIVKGKKLEAKIRRSHEPQNSWMHKKPQVYMYLFIEIVLESFAVMFKTCSH
jgi:hypothetical protein